MSTRRDYKDRLFRFIFGDPSRKEYTLQLYNALNGTQYEEPEDLELTTIDDVIYLSMKNDVAFVVDGRLNLFEQQSTFNPNMPLRGLLYFGKMYDKYVAVHDLNVFGGRQIMLPTPRYVVFYNGRRGMPARMRLSLTEAFLFPEESDVNVTATMININSEAGDEILARCKVLQDYSVFVGRVRGNTEEGRERDEAIDEAIDYCIDNDILKEVLLGHKSEVKGMILTEYDEKKVLEWTYRDGKEDGREEGWEEGRKEGRKEGRLEVLLSLVRDKALTIEQAAAKAGVTEEEFRAKMTF